MPANSSKAAMPAVDRHPPSQDASEATHGPGLASPAVGPDENVAWDNAQATLQARRLLALRWVTVVAMAVMAWAGTRLLGVGLPEPSLYLTAIVLAAGNALLSWRLRPGKLVSGRTELAAHFALDLAAWSAYLYFSGGAANPLISVLLIYVGLAAASVGALRATLLAGVAVLAYSLLWRLHAVLPVEDADAAIAWHLAGMWGTFVVSAAVMTWFITRLTAEIARRDRALAAAREAAMRDERLLALGTQAAHVAHRLGTPLSSISVLVRELELVRAQPAGASTDAEVAELIAELAQQIELCKRVLSSLVEDAQCQRDGRVRGYAVDDYLDQLLDQLALLRPDARIRRAPVEGVVPTITAEPTLAHALLNLLDNAVDASPEEVDIAVSWDAEQVRIDIGDRGPGMVSASRLAVGEPTTSSKTNGLGLGVFLSNATVERAGGKVELFDRPRGGLQVRVSLPRARTSA